MPIDAQQWRMRTGIINASKRSPHFTRGKAVISTKRKGSLQFDLPPPTWNGYRAAMIMLSVPVLYKFYTAILMTIVCLLQGSTAVRAVQYKSMEKLQYTNPSLVGHENISNSLLTSLCVFAIYYATTIVMVLVVMSDREHQSIYHWRYSTKSLCVDGRHRCVKETNSWGSLYLSLGLQSLAGSAVHHVPTLALLLLVLLCGDVERNPGPLGHPLDIKILMEKLSSVKSKWHLIGLQLGVKLSQLHVIEDQYSDIGRRLSETLQYWLDGNTEVPICWESIIEVLKCVDKKGLADQLHEEYCTVERVEDTTSTTSNVTDISASLSASASVASPSAMISIGAPCLVNGIHISFPSRGLSGHSDLTCGHLQARLYTDSVRMMGKFQTLLNTIMDSLEARRVPVKKIITQISAFGTFAPVHHEPDQPILKYELSKLRAEPSTSIDDIHFVITKYSSFFNYHVVAQLVKTFGTSRDKIEFEEYERAFREYAKRKVIECPSQVALIDDTNQTRIFVKLDDSYDGCTVSHLNLFIGKLSEVFHLQEGVLQLVNVNSGCFELNFQVPWFVQKAIFPLSLEQEKALAQLGVVKLCSGSYTYSWSQFGSDDKEDGGDGDRYDKPDDDSAFETGTARSELTELSEDFIDRELSDPYHGLMHDESNQPKEKCVGPVNLLLHNAAFTGKLEQVKKLVETESFSPLTTDSNGNTAIHYAAAGNQLEVIKYFIRTHGLNPVMFNRNGETPLHIAARRGHLEILKFFVEEEQLDPLEQDDRLERTALHASCLSKNLGVVRFLVNEVKNFVSISNIAQLETKHGHTPIHFAAAAGDLSILKYLLTDLNCNPNTKDHNGFTPLHFAAQGGHLNIVKYLIANYNCNPLQINKDKVTPLHSAASKGHLNVVKFLTVDKHVDPDCKTLKGSTPLHQAALNGHIETVQFLITKQKCDPNSPNTSGRTSLHAAADGGHLNIVIYLIHNHNNDPSQPNRSKFTPLHSAASKGHLNVVKFLSNENYFDPECRDSDGKTPLLLAALNGHIQTVQFLITELKCDPSSPNTSGWTPLHAAAEGGHLNIVEYLIHSNCDPSQPDKSKITPLHSAASRGHLNVVKFLTLEKSIDPDCKDSNGITPLLLATFYGHIEAVQFLVGELKCDPNSPNSSGRTLLHAAAQGGHLNIVEYLINNHSCDPSQPNKSKVTPLHSAASKGHLNVVKFLTLNKHVDPDCKDSNGITPVYLAALNGHFETVQFLITELTCDLFSPNTSCQTPLHAAAQSGHLNIVEYLIHDHNCDPSQPDRSHFTPLHSAASRGHINVVKFLSNGEHNDSEFKHSDGKTLLQAALNGHIETVQFLIAELKFDSKSLNSSGRTLLHAAAEGGHLNIVEYLIHDQNCNPSQPDESKVTPLHSAASQGHLNVVKFLISLDKKFNVDPECRDSNGITPVYLATLYGHIETVQFLIGELKCDPNSQNTFGRTPLHAAAKGGYLNIVEYLIHDQNCDPSQPDKKNVRPIHNAAFNGHLRIIKFLVEDKRVDPMCSDSNECTPLHLAKTKNHSETVAFLTRLMSKQPADH